MIFMVNHMRGDTCGNEWSEGEPTYFEADSMEAMWKKLKCPMPWRYWIGNKDVCRERTPKGQGYGIWEPNPDYAFKRDIGKVTCFKASSDGFGSILVEAIKVRK